MNQSLSATLDPVAADQTQSPALSTKPIRHRMIETTVPRTRCSRQSLNISEHLAPAKRNETATGREFSGLSWIDSLMHNTLESFCLHGASGD